MPRYQDTTGIILAGGSGKRLGGREKAFLEFQGQTFIQHLVGTFGRLFGRTIIVTNTPELYAGLGVRVVQDLIPRKGAIQGLITGLFYAPTKWSFAAACDTPLLREEFISLVMDAVEPGDRVVLPRTPDGIQPLSAAYHKDCRAPLTRMAREGERSFRALFQEVPTREIHPDQVMRADPSLLSFININTPSDLELLNAYETIQV